jgi:hypothetical protein
MFAIIRRDALLAVTTEPAGVLDGRTECVVHGVVEQVESAGGGYGLGC